MSQDKYAVLRREAAQARQKLSKPVRQGSSPMRDIAVGLVNPLALLPLSNDRVERIAIASAVTLFVTVLGLAFFQPNLLQAALSASPWLLDRLMPIVK
ncbi:MAG: hypothetical protein HYT14_00175 [Candidatus Liptonbacteria bacterium]|nr:hypothetical protein [Candidatus Liptonbacteria bacterium]